MIVECENVNVADRGSSPLTSTITLQPPRRGHLRKTDFVGSATRMSDLIGGWSVVRTTKIYIGLTPYDSHAHRSGK